MPRIWIYSFLHLITNVVWVNGRFEQAIFGFSTKKLSSLSHRVDSKIWILRYNKLSFSQYCVQDVYSTLITPNNTLVLHTHRDNVVSPVADIVRVKLERARWANPGGGAKRPSGRQHDSHLQHTHNPRDVSIVVCIFYSYNISCNSHTEIRILTYEWSGSSSSQSDRNTI